jgi:hypothetical protein
MNLEIGSKSFWAVGISLRPHFFPLPKAWMKPAIAADWKRSRLFRDSAKITA